MGHRQWLLQVSDDEYTKLLNEGIQPVATIDPNFASFTYTPRSLPEDDTSMVRTVGMVSNCHCPSLVCPWSDHGPKPRGAGVGGWGCTPRASSYLPPARGGTLLGVVTTLSPPVPSTGHPEHAAGHELHQ